MVLWEARPRADQTSILALIGARAPLQQTLIFQRHLHALRLKQPHKLRGIDAH